ncbi:sulfurtransferase [Cryobacterium arcticum]|uniref:Thiosulfate sulfurtransferase n=1 Tax=Cryobacterium arcticum TaxID=670052 RepID=A0A1B1BM96_9MICO|nr:thiosulfate sulfurtransferase [Cryobacterium arcticum]
MHTLITPADLAALLVVGPAPRILDVRWKLGGPPGRTEFRRGHLPGAVYVDLDTELAGHGEPTDGRHPLPAPDDLQAAARGWGLNDGDTVVVYDDLGNMSSARAWWLLRNAGVRDVRLLDGGLGAWRADGLPVVEGEEPVTPGSVTLGFGALPTLDADAAAALAQDGVLLDARAAERYRGDSEPIDPRAGHIPGAVNAPTGGNLDADGRFLPAAELRARFEALGVRAWPGADAAAGRVGELASAGAPASPVGTTSGAADGDETEAGPDASGGAAAVPDAGFDVGVYCGSGVTAAHEAVALTLAGFAPALYPGSWSQWSNMPDRPVATGDAPGH